MTDMHWLIAPVILSLLAGVSTSAIARSDDDMVSGAVQDVAADDRFELTITTPKVTWAVDEPIEVDATFAYLNESRQAVVTSGGGAIVVIEVEQLDGPIDTGWSRELSCVRHVFGPGDVESYPYSKSGHFDLEGKMGDFWREWTLDPELRLPIGRYRVIARADYGPKRCGTGSSLEAAVTIDVVDEAPGDSPTQDSGSLTPIVRAVTSLPALFWPDAPAPASVARFVPAVRDQLWTQAIDGLRLPLHLRFVEARCQADGPGVALVFEELGPPYLTATYAYAARDSMPSSEDDAWSGGYGMSDVLADPEFIHQMGADTVPCT